MPQLPNTATSKVTLRELQNVGPGVLDTSRAAGSPPVPTTENDARPTSLRGIHP